MKGFKKRKTGPYLICRANELGTIAVIVYVDDTLVIGDKQ